MAKEIKLHPKHEKQAELIADKAIQRMEKHFVTKAEALKVIITCLIALGLFLFARPDLQDILKGTENNEKDRIKYFNDICGNFGLWK